MKYYLIFYNFIFIIITLFVKWKIKFKFKQQLKQIDYNLIFNNTQEVKAVKNPLDFNKELPLYNK